MKRENINNKVVEWLREKTGLDINELPDNDLRLRRNTDGTILVNRQYLETKGLKNEYMEFLESLKPTS